MPASTRRRRLLLAIPAILIASGAGVEIGSRILDRARGKPFDAQAQRASIASYLQRLGRAPALPNSETKNPNAEPDQPTEPQILHPYTSWSYAGVQKRIADDADYYHGPEAERNYDVCILGGSVAEFFGTEGKDRLTEVLRRSPGLRDREIRIHGYGISGAKQLQPLMMLSYLLALGHKPDAVIEIDGFNEAALGWTNAKTGTHPLYPYIPFWAGARSGLRTNWELVGELWAIRSSQERAIGFASWFQDSGLWRSSFLSRAASQRMARLRKEYVDAVERYTGSTENRKDSVINGPRFAADDEGEITEIVEGWMAASISMHGMCAQRGVAYLHVLQPTLHDAGSKPLTQKEQESSQADPHWIEGVKRIYPRLREAGPAILARGTPFLDATGVFRDQSDDIYYDVCHFNHRGNELLADAIGEALAQAQLPAQAQSR